MFPNVCMWYIVLVLGRQIIRTWGIEGPFKSMIGENRQLVTNEPVEFEKTLLEVQDCRIITDHFRGIYRLYPNIIKGKPKDVNM